MGKALELLKREEKAVAKKSKVRSRSLTADLSVPVSYPGAGREVSLGAVARYWSLKDRQARALGAELDLIKGILRAEAQKVVANDGGYAGKVEMGRVEVVRQNRYKPVPFNRDELVEAVGGVEYSTLFEEKATIEFGSVMEMRQFLSRCEMAGVSVGGEISEVVKPRKSFAERLSQIEDDISGEVRELLAEKCSTDSEMGVGRKK